MKKKFHELQVNLVVTFNCRRTNLQKLAVQRLLQDAIEERLQEASGDDTQADDLRIGHVMLESTHETGEICI